eukprot:6413015-Lingulodinium_polyedra.AAC.1
MDAIEVQPTEIKLERVKAMDDTRGDEAYFTCCKQMYYALALITSGSVRALVRTVEETNGAEAWRLIHARYAPDTQNW